ncbi:AT-hook motif nuclear-localized protein 1-like [Andrographis paniculata]|uniref:AT-hook motif nuclear-localized protein 1-like n=1 Tax=Andrographis paniculata TaxID=175694 RepID=UPI0021E71913|nr:AT-hook motif nuclear-localized protein 1-like [Andrographis paniculata]XP_051132876.1 AT-hook motif nuclear-localized protein 1-like [Andrographis paniculata]XP_051132877.1 AT-hook motif nuclear-localized protein 1-like [Andrographis paniculata]
MDSGKAIASGVTVIAPGASSSYHVVPRTDNMGQHGMLPMDSPAGSERKKRGRPRKYRPDESVDRVFLPTPISSAAPSVPSKSYAEETRPRLEQPISSEKKQRNKVGAEKLDNLVNCFTGSSFLPHVLTVNSGEDITTKIMEFSLQGPRTVCVLSSYGTVSSVTLTHPNSPEGTLTYEGLFEILSFSGSFSPVETPNSKFDRTGMMRISLAGADGRVVGGQVAGLTVAASPVHVVIVSFLLSPLDLKLKKPKLLENAPRIDADGSNGKPTVNVQARADETQAPPENVTNWTSMERSRKSAADINISLQG